MEPSENELRQMLEARERDQAASWQGLRKKATKATLIGILALGAIAMAIPSSREILFALARELPKALSDEPQQATASSGTGGQTATPEGTLSNEDMLKRATAIGAHATGTAPPDAKDLEFGKELLNFMMGKPDAPVAPAAPPATAAPAPAPVPATAPTPAPPQTVTAPQTPPKVAGRPGAKP